MCRGTQIVPLQGLGNYIGWTVVPIKMWQTKTCTHSEIAPNCQVQISDIQEPIFKKPYGSEQKT